MTEIRENEDGKELEKTLYFLLPRSSIRATEWRLATRGSNILVIPLSSHIQLCDPMDCSTPGFPVLHHVPESVQTHVDDAIQPSYLLLLPLSSCPQPFPESGSVSMNPLFTLGGQSIGALASASGPSSEYSGLISFRIDSFDLLPVQGILKSLLQHHSSKTSILQPSAFFMVQLSHLYMTTRNNTKRNPWV